MITDARLHELIKDSLKGRQNAYKRSLRIDARAALRGNACCRESLTERFSKRELAIVLPVDLADAIDKYLNTNWNTCDPSRIGAANAVAYIGERVVALYSLANGR